MRTSPSILLLALLVAPLAAQERTLVPGQSVTGVLGDADPTSRTRRAPYHIWTLEGRRGQRLVIDMGSAEFDTYLVVRDAEGFMVGSDDDGGEGTDSRLRVILPRDGRYRVIATAFSQNGRGNYSLTARPWDVPQVAPPGQGATLAIGSSGEGLLEPGDDLGPDGGYMDRWQVDVRQGARVRAELRSSDFDAFLVVYGPDGVLLGTNDDGLPEGNAVVSFRAATAGRYTIVATSYPDNPVVGSYQLQLSDETGRFAEPGERATISSGQTREGRLEPGDQQQGSYLTDVWVFQGRAGQIARIDVMSTEFDVYATLLDDAGAVLASDDDGGEGTNSRIAHTLPRTGTYTLQVRPYSQSQEGGLYSVSLVVAEAPAGPGRSARLRPGERAMGRLEQGDNLRDGGGFTDTWEFDARAGQTVLLDMISREFDAYLELYDPRGNLVASDDDGGEGTDSFISAGIAQNGRYRIQARSFGESQQTGFYELQLELADPAAPPGRVMEIRLDRLQVGRLEAGDSVVGDGTYADVYLLRPARDGQITIDMRSAEFDTYLILTDSEGNRLATDDDGGTDTNSLLTFQVRGGRTYRVLANSFGGEPATGTYRIVVRGGP
ncbi:MAG TPA: PPC domain-containing protein [Gemmatimonadales bacterium]|nr:PPC domain-containing protein [Gemmatimonadales bacterium]